MKHRKLNQDGFIPMIICILVIVGLVIYFAFRQVAAQPPN
jgi:hypothetical protein